MVITSLPPGFRFHPTDVELVKFYLKRKVLGQRFPIEAIAEVDIYKFPPWDLQDKACLSRDLKWYFFCPRGRKYATGARTNRSTDFGFWKTTGKDRPVIYKGEPVGMIKSLIFHRRSDGERKSERTDWVMHEYRLEDEDLKTKGVAQDAFVLCMIYQKDGRGPRNGAQYGAPYNEEEWEDDGEADAPSASAFAQAFLPDKQKHSVDIRITDPERYCVESTSKACQAGPSQMVPSVVNVPPQAPTNDVTMVDRQNVFNDYRLSHGIFSDDIPAASSENDKVENLDQVNPDGIHKAEITMDDIFNGLEDLGDSLATSHHVNDLFTPSEPFVELNDFISPLTSVDTGPSGHNHSERCLSAFDHSIAPQSFRTPVIPDENAPGLGLIDLESPLTFSGEAGQSNQAYALFSALGGSDGLGGFGTISNSPAFAQPFHGSEVTQVTEDFPQLSWYPRLDPMEGRVDMHQEGQGHGVGECTNQEIVRYGAGAANSPIDNPDLGCAHACENLGRGEETIFCCMLHFLEYPAHPSSAVERPAPITGAKKIDGHALFLLYGDSSFHVKAEVTLGGGGRGCTNDALLRGLEGFPFVTDCEENGSGSGKVAANCGCGILSSLVELTLSGYYAVLALRTCIIGALHDTFRLLFLDVVWLIEQNSVWCACIERSVSSASVLFVFSLLFGIRSFSAPHITCSSFSAPISFVSGVGSFKLLRFQLISSIRVFRE